MARMCDWKFRRDECLRLARVIADVCDDWSSAFGSFDEPTSLSGEFDPSGLSGINGYPLFHQPAVAWVEVSTATSADELIDPFSRKLGDKPALHEHRKNFTFHAQNRTRTEHLLPADMGVIGKGSDHWHETGIKVARIFLRGSLRDLLQSGAPR